MAYESEHYSFGIPTFQRILHRRIYCEGPTGCEEDAFMFDLTPEACGFACNHPIVNCIDEIQYSFAIDTYNCIVEGRQDGNAFCRRVGFDVDVDELKCAVEKVTENKSYVNIELSSFLENLKM
jgi:hypothetical protein